MHAYMHTCMHVCMYACVRVCMYACMHVCMYACMHVCMYACVRVCMYVSMHVCMMYMCMCVRVYMHVCMCACMHVRMHASLGVYVRNKHTYMCMRTHPHNHPSTRTDVLRARHLPSRRPRARHLAAVPRPARQVKRRKLRPQPHSDDDDDVSGEAGAATHRAHAQAPTHGGTRARRRHAKACCESRGARQSSCEGRQWAAGTSPGIAYGDTGVA